MKYFKEKHSIKLFNRSIKNVEDAKRVGINAYSFNDLETFIPDFDLIINSTSVGHTENIHGTPISLNLLERAKKTMIVYDIIYDPLKTILLKDSEKLGLKTINGLRMNLFQAVLAYSYTNKTNLSLEDIYKIMN